MPTEKPVTIVKRSVPTRIFRVLLFILIGIFVLALLVIVLVQTPYVQNIARKKAQSFLSNKLHTTVAIGRLYIGFPQTVELDNIYIEDQAKDTLLAGQKLKVNLSMWKLIHSNIEINSIELKGITANIKRVLPDTTFNFKFITDAFAGGPKKKDTAAGKPMQISLDRLLLDNIRIRYVDVLTGNDDDVWISHSVTRVNTFDLTRMNFVLGSFQISGVRAKIYQHTPLVPSPPPSGAATSFLLAVKKIDLNSIRLDYQAVSTAAQISIGSLRGDIQSFDLARQQVTLKKMDVRNSTAVITTSGQGATSNQTPSPKSDSTAGWQVDAGNLVFLNNNFQFDDKSKKRLPKGMDFSHLDAAGVNLVINKLHYSTDTIAGSIARGSLQESSGFRLDTLQGEFLYANHAAYLRRLLIKTPGTVIRRSIELEYPSIAAIQKNPDLLRITADLDNSRIAVKDILTFMPSLGKQPIFSNPAAVLHLNTQVKGSLSNLSISRFQFSGIGSTAMDFSGTLQHVADPKRFTANLSINTLTSTSNDIVKMLPAGTLPKNIILPEKFSVSGRFNGGLDNLLADLHITSSAGDIALKGTASRLTDKERARYNLVLILTRFDLNKVLVDTARTFGLVTATLKAKGQGYNIKTADAHVQASVQSAVIRQYPYQHFNADAVISNQNVVAKADIHDPHIQLSMQAAGNFGGNYPPLKVSLQIDSIRTRPLHLTTADIFYRGNIAADFPDTDPDSLVGKLLITESVLLKDQLRIPMDSIAIAAGKTDSGRFLTLSSDVVNLRLNGRYQLSKLGNILDEAMEPYFTTVDDSDKNQIPPYDFTLTGTVTDRPLLKALLPGLDSLNTVTLDSHFSNENGWKADLVAPLIIYGTNIIHNVQLRAATQQDQLMVHTSIDEITSGSSLNIYSTGITATIAHNKIDFSLLNKDHSGKNKYHLAGLFQQPAKGTYQLSFKPDSLMLNYEPWTITAGNQLQFGKKGINISQFNLAKNNQQLSINSSTPAPDAPVEIKFTDFRLSTLSSFVKQDSLLVDGVLAGTAQINDLNTKPIFETDLTVNNLAMYKDTLGNLSLKVNNEQAQTYAADIQLTGRGNDVAINGKYYSRPDSSSSFDLLANIRKLDLHSIEGATNNAITDASGSLNGQMTFAGTVSQPKINGQLNFDKTRFNLGMLNSYFSIDQENIAVDNSGIHFNTFTILDSAGNKAVLDGSAYTTDLKHYKFDLKLTADNFHALSTTKRKDALYYGQLYFSTELGISGTDKAPIVDGRLSVDDKTKLFLVLPQKEPGIEEREGIVKFVNMNAPPTDFVFENAIDSVNRSSTLGMDISVNVEIKKDAELNIIIDAGNGDLLSLKGEASLSAAINPGGKISLTGTYAIQSGSYDLTFNLLKRKFDIQKGSVITFKGEPTSAEVDLTAVYVAFTAPLDLVKDQLEGSITTIRNTYLQKLPFQVDLIMKGELLKPQISFDIQLPDTKNYNVSKNIIELVNQKLTELRKEPSELNKQVFALLLLGRFVTENPFESSGGGTTAESFARASVSKLLTQQLNQLASDLVKGVNLNFDVVSADDYSTGYRQNRTDLNVALSKTLLNDRLTVTVGSNFELEGAQNSPQQSTNIAGNVAVDYQLSKDGRYYLRAYRKNDYQGIIDGYVIETGIGFIVTVDYNKFVQIFRSQK